MRTTLVALLLVSVACTSSPAPSTLNVATQNLYLGGDLFAIANAATLEEATVATFDLWASVQATNFPARAKVLAAGIAAQGAEVVALQEVSIYRTGAPLVCNPDGSGLVYINDPIASEVAVDFLDSLQAELLNLGLRYDVAWAEWSFDAEFCAVDPTFGTPPFDLRYTEGDVILVRSDLPWRNAAGGLYSTAVQFPIPGTDISVPDARGWARVEVQKDGAWYRVYATHLEVQELPTPPPVPGYVFQLGQAGELVAGEVIPRYAASPMPTIVMGDMNSQAEQPAASSLRTTYDFLAGNRPFPDLGYPPFAPFVGVVSPLADAWVSAQPGQPGLTWGYDADLRAGSMTQRIDLVLTLGAGPYWMNTFGAGAMTSTSPPLYGSDHLGLAAGIQAY